MKPTLVHVIGLLLGIFSAVFGAVLIAAIVGIGFLFPDDGTVFLKNISQQDIQKIHLEICRRKYEIEQLKTGEVKRLDFGPIGEGHYEITVEFDSQKKLHKELGYVCSGIHSVDILMIQNNDIILKSVKELLKSSQVPLTTP